MRARACLPGVAVDADSSRDVALPGEAARRAAFDYLKRKFHWSITYEEANEDPIRSRLVDIETRHPNAAQKLAAKSGRVNQFVPVHAASRRILSGKDLASGEKPEDDDY